MSPLVGLSKRGAVIPALFALGHIMTALAGLPAHLVRVNLHLLGRWQWLGSPATTSQ